MDADRLTLGEKVLGGSALALFILSFIGIWVKIEVEGAGLDFTERVNAWDGYGFLVKVALLLALVAIALVVARAAGANLDIPWSPVYLGVGGVAFAFMLLALLVGPEESGFPGLEISRGIGLFLGTLLAAGMAAGAWMHQGGTTSTTATPPADAPPPPA